MFLEWLAAFFVMKRISSHPVVLEEMLLRSRWLLRMVLKRKPWAIFLTTSVYIGARTLRGEYDNDVLGSDTDGVH